MAGSGWRKTRPLKELLLAEPQSFDMLQAARLLEVVGQGRRPVGEGADGAAEALRFRSTVQSVFPASDLAAVRSETGPTGRPRYAVSVTFMGLAGAFGPLPPPITELLTERLRAGDHAMRDFLDLFNHRLVSLLVRARRTHRPELTNRPPWETNLAGFLTTLCGLGTPHLTPRLPDGLGRALPGYAGLLNRTPATQHGLERILSTHFGTAVVIEPLAGGWMRLEREDRSVLGRSLDSGRLGRGAVLGAWAWDQTAGITVNLGPLGLREYLGFLPGRRAARQLAAIVAFHAGPHLRVRLRLRVKRTSVPNLTLRRGRLRPRLTRRPSANLTLKPVLERLRRKRTGLPRPTRKRGQGARLGWTSWLGRPATGDAVVQVRLGRAAGPY